MSNVKSAKIVRLKSQFDAAACFISFVMYVITHPHMPLSLLFLGLFTYNGVSLKQYFTTEQAKVEVAKPIAEVRGFSLMSEAIAQEKPKENGIYIDGKLYGYFDPDVEAWKLAGKPLVLIHQRSSGAVFTVEVAALEPSKMKSLK